MIMGPLLRFLPIVVAVTILGQGCAQQTMTKQETLNATTRTYKNVVPETILRAASDLFFLANDRAFQTTRTPDRFIAQRAYGLMNIVKAQDTWTVQTRAYAEGTIAVLDVKSEETWLIAIRTNQIPEGPAVYEQFWNRMDYLLGQSPGWMSCQNLTYEYLEDRTWGDTWWLCDQMLDRKPPGLVEGKWMQADGTELSKEDHEACSRKVLEGVYGKTDTELQRELYRSFCFHEKGYEEVTDQ